MAVLLTYRVLKTRCLTSTTSTTFSVSPSTISPLLPPRPTQRKQEYILHLYTSPGHPSPSSLLTPLTSRQLAYSGRTPPTLQLQLPRSSHNGMSYSSLDDTIEDS